MFKSSNFVFRQTVLGEALAKAGLEGTFQAREPKIEAVLRQPRDRYNTEPSRNVHLDPVVKPKGAFGRDKINA